MPSSMWRSSSGFILAEISSKLFEYSRAYKWTAKVGIADIVNHVDSCGQMYGMILGQI